MSPIFPSAATQAALIKLIILVMRITHHEPRAFIPAFFSHHNNTFFSTCPIDNTVMQLRTDIMDIMDIRDIMEIINIMVIMDIMDIMDMMDIIIITAWMAMWATLGQVNRRLNRRESRHQTALSTPRDVEEWTSHP